MAVGLLLAALVVGVAGPAYLRRAIDAGSAPHVALAAWIGTGIVFLTLLAAAPVVMHLRPLEGIAPVSAAAAACAGAFDSSSGAAWPAVLRGVALGAGAGIALVAVVVVAVAARRSRHAGRAHVRALRSLVESVDRVDGVTVWWIADDEPVAYAVPGRSGPAGGSGTVVASTALWDLPAERRRAVLDHEIAHLRGRHHLAVTATRALRSALAVVPLLRGAAAEVAVLVELLADRRAAAGRGGVAAVRGAMGDLGAAAGRSAVLAARPVPVVARVPGPARVRDAGSAAVHALSPALTAAAVGTAAFLAACPGVAG